MAAMPLSRPQNRPASLVVLLIVVSLSLGLVSAAPRPAAAAAVATGMQFGARVQSNSGETPQQAIERVEALSGRKLAVVRDFLSWDSAFPSSFHTWVGDRDQTLILSVKSRRENGQVVPWRELAAAAPGSPLYDTAVSWADRMRDYGHPVYFAFNHEPESAASSTMGTAAEFVAAWRTMHTIFAERGATNVKFIWIMTDYAFFVGAQAPNDAAKWYPGDAYLDAMGTDAYNWFTCRPGVNTAWHPLEQIIKPFRDFGAKHPDKELWLTEWASAEDAAQPDRKPAWFDEAQALFKRPDYAQFRGISYFNYTGTTTCHWKINSSPQTTAAFRTMAQDPFYGGASTFPPSLPVTVVASASANGNHTLHRVRIPPAVRAGDTLLLFLTANQNPVSPSTPAGWTVVRSAATSDISSRLWSRTATSADAGTTLTITTPVTTKSDLKVVAFRAAATPAVDVQAAAVDTVSRLSYPAPSVTPTRTGDLVVVYWADKSSTNTGQTIPATLKKVEPTTGGTGGGYITATVATGGAGVAGTRAGPFTATGTQLASRAVAYTVALRS